MLKSLPALKWFLQGFWFKSRRIQRSFKVPFRSRRFLSPDQEFSSHPCNSCKWFHLQGSPIQFSATTNRSTKTLQTAPREANITRYSTNPAILPKVPVLNHDLKSLLHIRSFCPYKESLFSREINQNRYTNNDTFPWQPISWRAALTD